MAPFDRNGAPRRRTHRMASQYGMRYEPRMLASVRAGRPWLFVCTEAHACKQARACRRTLASARAFNATAGRTGYVEGCLLNLVRCSCIRRDGWAGGRSPESARAARAARHRRRASARRRRPRRSARACAAIVRACGVLCACAPVGSMTDMRQNGKLEGRHCTSLHRYSTTCCCSANRHEAGRRCAADPRPSVAHARLHRCDVQQATRSPADKATTQQTPE